MSVEFKDLVGVQMLDAVDYGALDGAANIMRVRLCGVTYVFEEDPDDGYRSHLRDVRVADTSDLPIKNVIPMTIVDCELDQDGGILLIKDRANGKVVIEAGTDYSDNYYPFCIMHWNPENLQVNIDKNLSSS
jgi:hypothetical protein